MTPENLHDTRNPTAPPRSFATRAETPGLNPRQQATLNAVRDAILAEHGDQFTQQYAAETTAEIAETAITAVVARLRAGAAERRDGGLYGYRTLALSLAARWLDEGGYLNDPPDLPAGVAESPACTHKHPDDIAARLVCVICIVDEPGRAHPAGGA